MSRNKWNKPRPLFASPVPKEVRKPKIKWKIFAILWSALKRGAMVLGFLMIFSSFVSAIMLASVAGSSGPKGLPSEMVLVLDFDKGVAEIPPEASLANPIVDEVLTIRDYVQIIRRAKSDPRVKGVVARLRDGGFALSHIDEIRSAIVDFKESGKFTKIYASSYGAGGGGLGRYYLASVFDEIWMQPMGLVSITGVSAQQPFVREVLDQIGIEPQFFQRKAFKSAYENLTNKEMSAANREATQALINDLVSVLSKGIATDRGFEEAAFKALVDKGLFVADEALEAGLIDRSDYADVLVREINLAVSGNPEGGDLSYVYAADYLPAIKAKAPNVQQAHSSQGFGKTKPRVALIYAVGAIMSDDVNAHSSLAPSVVMGQQIASARKIAPAILDAVEDDGIDTIVLRVDSPGGSPIASESILRALVKAKEKGKNVIVSMGSVAASGGYWIATNADQIFVSPLTITGSIGVIGGKFASSALWEKLGVNWESVSWGENAGMWSFVDPFSASEAERINAMLDHVYDNFLSRVAAGRNMELEQVERLAQGRVWSGASALENGLADQQGGLYDALDYAATLSGGQSAEDIAIEILPKPKTPIEQLIALLTGEVSAAPYQYGLGKAVSGMLSPLAVEVQRMQNPEDFLLYDPVHVR